MIIYLFFKKSSFMRGEGKKKKEKNPQALSFIRIKKKQDPREERRDEKEKFD